MLKNLLRSLALVAAGMFPGSALAAQAPTVFAAVSMKEALEAAASEFQASGGPAPHFSFAASSVLARQIEAGAPTDLFISADAEWMDWLAERGLIEPETRRTVAGNVLVIAATQGTEAVADPGPLLAGRFAMGDPAHVPAGRYAQAALESLGLWGAVRANAVFGVNVRVALELVSRGEVGAAIVYASDLRAAPKLAKAYTFPEGTHARIIYPAALVTGDEERRSAKAFLDFLMGAACQRILADHGFTPAP